MPTNFKIYDVVRITEVHREPTLNLDAFNLRLPQVGDVATIVEVYENPSGYELECSNQEGITEWLISVEENDFQLELLN